MTDLPAIRLAYLSKLGLYPNGIPGKRCLAGDYDNAPGMKAMLEAQEAEHLRNLSETTNAE